MSKYKEIADDIRKGILDGKYTPNEQLPLEKEMCQYYDVSRITIKKAVDELVNDGLVVKRRGAGTFVKDVDSVEAKELSMSRQFSGFSASHKKDKIKSKIAKFEVINATAEIAEKLRITEEDFVYHIIRTRYNDDNPVVVEYTYMPISLIPGIKNDVLESSIYGYIEGTLKLKIKSAHRTIRAARPNDTDRENLEIDESYPILTVDQVAFLDNGKPFEYSSSHHKFDTIEFKTVSIK